jgi:Transposase DDE domain
MSRRKRSRLTGASKAKPRREHVSQKPNKEHLAAMLDWLLPDGSIFSKMRLHGNTKWLPKHLVCLALFWAWSESKHVTDAYDEAAQCCQNLFQSVVLGSYQGFMGALTRWTATFLNILWPVLHERMEEIGGRFWRIHGWVPIAFDGSRSTAPRTRNNEKAFCAPHYGKSNSAKYRRRKIKGMRRRNNDKNKPQPQEPQAWITLLWHMGLRLPWMWQLGPSNSSERDHVKEMIRRGKFAKNTLYCGDAGFVGFPLWSDIIQSGRHFLVRVGGNVSLLREGADYELAKNGLVLCWPRAMQAKQPPLRLRLVKVRIGQAVVYLLTSVLDSKKLTVKQMVTFYKMRWGIEVEFRGLKQTLDRAKLRCRNDRRLLAELDWSILAMAVAELSALKEQLAKKPHAGGQRTPTPDPAQRSLAQTMRAIRRCIRTLDALPRPRGDLQTLLREAITDSYRRKTPKRSRYRPANPDKKPLGAPNVRKLNNQEKKRLRDSLKELAV